MRSPFFPLAASVLPFVLAGCSADFGNSAQSSTSSPMVLSGKIYGGQQPVVGSTVYLYAASSAGTGSAAYGTGATDLLTNTSVTTNNSGNFTITGDFNCTPGTMVYAVAIGGSPGVGQPANSAIAMMDAIGDCAQLSSTSFIYINEVSTVAAVSALQQFMKVSGGIPNIGSSAANAIGLKNAFANATSVVNIAAGAVSANTTTVTYPAAEINTLADALAACINSSGPASTPCTTLFTDSPGSVTPSNTMQAMLNIAQTPGANPSGIYGLVTPTAPFQPTLASAPNDFTVALTYTGGSMYTPTNLAIDATGNAFVFDCELSCTLTSPNPTTSAADKIVEFSPTGAVLTPAAGIHGAGVHNAAGMVIDTSGFLWTANTGTTRSGLGNAGDSIGHFAAAANADGSTSFTSPRLSSPYGIVLDTTGNAFVTSIGNGGINYVTSAGAVSLPYTVNTTSPFGIALTPTNLLYVADDGSNTINQYSASAGTITYLNGFNPANVSLPNGVAIDAGNNAWYVSSGGPSVAAINSAGTRIGIAAPSGLGTIAAIAIDGKSRAWVPSCNQTCVTSGGSGNTGADALIEVANNGSSLSVVSPATGFTAPSLAAPAGVAIDPSGNVWITNSLAPNGTVTVFLGAAGPVLTPLQAALINNKVGQMP